MARSKAKDWDPVAHRVRVQRILDGSDVDPVVDPYRDLLSSAWAQATSGFAGGHAPTKFEEFRGRELAFAQEVLGARMWQFQRALIERLLEHRRVTVRGNRKATKTHAAALLLESFMQTSPTIAITSAPSDVQVRTLLWAKINAVHANARDPLRGEIFQKSLTIGPEHYALGFSTNKSDRFQGFHGGVDVPEDPDAPPEEMDPEALARLAHGAVEITRTSATRLLFIFDEAAGIEQYIFDAVKGSFMGDNVYVLYLANPTCSVYAPHEYSRSHMDGGRFHRIKVCARADTPEDPDPVHADETFIVPHWATTPEQLEAEYPRDHPMHDPYVRARFLEGNSATVVVTHAMLAAADVDEERDEKGDLVQRFIRRGAHVGVDTSGKGDDWNVATLAVDSVVLSTDRWRSSDQVATWERLRKICEYWREALKIDLPWTNVHIDDAPIAQGIISIAAREGCALDCVAFGGAPTHAWKDTVGGVKYFNRRAELYWVLRELLRTKRARIPKRFDRIWTDLAATQYSITEGSGELKIEPKDDIEKRLGHSPDDGDSCVLAFAVPRNLRAFTLPRKRWI